ncbi:hypothetical protein L596_026178 [Steinernema carpocapsae]|nr:hypothetical protein L596_026178 [Steinernema carpocapsae]
MADLNSLCALGEIYSRQTLFIVLSIVKCVITGIGCLSLGFVYFRQRVISMFHPNARLIFKLHVTFLVLTMIGTFMCDGGTILHFTLLKWMSKDSACPVHPISPFWMLTRFAVRTGCEGVTYTATAWIFERIYATVLIGSYEKKNTTIGWVFCLASIACAVGAAIVRAKLGDYSLPMAIMRMPETTYNFNMVVTHICATLEFLNVIAVLVLLMVNQQRLRKTETIECSLTSKYQIRENVQASALIFPLAMLQCISFLPSDTIIPFVTKNTTFYERTTTYANAEWVCVYFVTLPLCLWWRNRAQT